MNQNDILANTKQYLLEEQDILQDDKRYVMSFYQKTEYLNKLRDTAIKELNEPIITGYGDVNSKICFVFADEDTLKRVKPVLQQIFESIRLNLWDVYITFINKTVTDYQGKYWYLVNELYAVGGKLLYVIDDTQTSCQCISQIYQAGTITNTAEKMFYVPVNEICRTDIEDHKHLWKVFKYLINYRN